MIRILLLLAAAAVFTLSNFAAHAQTPAKKTPTASEVSKAVEALAGLTGGEGDNSESVGRVARKVVAYLKVHRPDEAAAERMGLMLAAGSDDQAQMGVYIFTHSSGGTRGTVSNVVLQWQNAAGKLFAYHLPVECAFYHLFPLQTPGRKMYLLMGREKSDTFCRLSVAYVVELKGDYLILDNKVFGDYAGMDICNVEMKFDVATQVLSVEEDNPFADPDEPVEEPFRPSKYEFRQGRFVELP